MRKDIFSIIFRFKLARYLISGAAAAVVSLGSLFVLTDLVGVWYLYGSSIAFALSVIVSFTLQKLWTFKNRQLHRKIVGLQAFYYVALAVVNLFLNVGIIFLLVEYLGVWHILAQAISGLLVAISSFFLYHLIFAVPLFESHASTSRHTT